MDPKKISRSELYEMVWTKPISKVAVDFHLSDVGLANVCEKHGIPIPPRGYWAKKRNGKSVRRSPLPPIDIQELQEVRLYKKAPKPPPIPEAPPPPVNDPDVLVLLEKIKTMEPVVVGTELQNPHSLVRQTKKALRQGISDLHNLVLPPWDESHTYLNVQVSKESIPRALIYMDHLIKTLKKLGGKLEVKQEGNNCQTLVRFFGDSPLELRLRERYNQVRKPQEVKRRMFERDVDYIPNGLFVLEGQGRWSWKVFGQDKKNRKIEDQILPTIASWIQLLGENRIAERKAETERIKKEEESRIYLEKLADWKRRQEELLKRQKEEQTKIRDLYGKAKSWMKTKILREYIQEVQRRVRESGVETQEMTEWLQWAQNQADRLDPFLPSPSSVLDTQMEDPPEDPEVIRRRSFWSFSGR